MPSEVEATGSARFSLRSNEPLVFARGIRISSWLAGLGDVRYRSFAVLAPFVPAFVI
jgi:hypothetical protein